jgi:hypothetical protein
MVRCGKRDENVTVFRYPSGTKCTAMNHRSNGAEQSFFTECFESELLTERHVFESNCIER